MQYKNNRPSLLQLPSGLFVMPMSEFEASEEDMRNPGMKIALEAGVITPVESALPAPAPVNDPPKAAKAKALAKKLEAVAKAEDADTLIKLADGETDTEVLAAIEAKAAEFVK